MEINMELYGYGVGLVMIGWVAGLIVSYAFSVIRVIGKIA